MGQTLSNTFISLSDHLLAQLPTTQADLRGRTYIVTGSNVGVGLATAIHLARLNPARLILAVRNLEKGEAAKRDIITQTNFAGALEVWELEMEDFSSVVAFAERANTSLDRLDGAILNAGILSKDWSVTIDGWERMLQVNVLSTGLLSVLLLPRLQTTTKLPPPHPDVSHMPPHLTITGSAAQIRANLSTKRLSTKTDILLALNDPNKIKSGRYPISKLFNLVIARKVAHLPRAEGVVVNVAHPGTVYTEIVRDYKLGRFVMFWFRLVGWSPAKGALNLLYAVLSPTPPGAYIATCQIREPPPWIKTKEGLELQKTAWDELVALWRRVCPEVDNIL
ncbi:hypothetical protein GGX14DRAFT_625892 [Mycena pura]|uniref:NAD(P)-binding protein n=1 Tax=Mycena pura TaxID=153505 RepID=A0AAD6YAP8_9AGAR|nr:hypothetical protein GGX14DRAFT_625892 [Mycena pura]